MFPWSRAFLRDRTGAVAPLVGIALVGLVAMGGLAWDVSRAFALRGELDSAVDAAALAGATQLDQGSDAITRATTAAKGALVTNSQRLADSPEASVAVADADITFLQDLTTRALATSDANANFIQINLTPRKLGLITGALVYFTKFNVTAHAVAGYGSAICVAPPILICNPNESSDPNFNGDNYIGKAIQLTPSPNNKTDPWYPGQFGFLDVGTGGQAIMDAMGAIKPTTECFGSTVVTEPGTITSADQWFNMRFDIYASGVSKLKNNPNYAPALDSIIGVQNTSSDCSPTPVRPSNDCGTTAAATPYGLPLDCNMSISQQVGSGVWNVQRYFASNHSGIDPTTYTPATPSSPMYSGAGWAAYGPPPVSGGTSPTRYQVYNWELAILSHAISKPAGAFSSGQDGTPTNTANDWAQPSCNTSNPTQQTPDRRVISAVVANCQADDVKGQTTVHVISDVDIFLIAPVTSDMTIYGEVVGQTSAAIGSTLGKPTKRYWVRLYE